MANTGRIPLWLVGLVGGLAVITMLSLFIYGSSLVKTLGLGALLIRADFLVERVETMAWREHVVSLNGPRLGEQEFYSILSSGNWSRIFLDMACISNE